MKRFVTILNLLLIIVLTSNLAGCGGGSPSVYTMKGLEGTWDFLYILSGTIDTKSGDLPYNETISGVMVIETTSVKVDNDFFVWKYNGSKLELSFADINVEIHATCGQVIQQSLQEFEINIKSGAYVAQMDGTSTMSWTYELCDDDNRTGEFTMSGTMTKR